MKLNLDLLDWLGLAIFLFLTLIISIRYSQKRGNLSSYFQAEGKLPWFVAGTAMVATTFAADTPLAVTEFVAKDGISGNWSWWFLAFGSVFTVFFFAPLWKRSGVGTDLEFLELRYSGLGSKFLRAAKAVYLGGFLNIIILAWVNLAMLKILSSFLEENYAIAALVFLMLFALAYTSLLGLKGISYLDVFQFFFAMSGCIILAINILNLDAIGGLEGLKAKSPESKLEFFPKIDDWSGFLILILFLWWNSWYPGSEPGGGGYIAQRILASENETAATRATLWFVFAHYFIRPWPWILVALASLILFPNLSEQEKGKGFIYAIEYGMGSGGKGILLSSFLAAYLSTVATHLNWGSSYLVQDLTKPYLMRGRSDSEYLKHSYILQASSALFAILVCVYLLETVRAAWVFLLEASAGIGFALVFRWFWWRVSAWSELAGFLVAPLFFFCVSHFTDLVFPYSAFLTGLLTIGFVLGVTILGPKTEEKRLEDFYNRVRPWGWGWTIWAKKKGFPTYRSEWFLRSSGVFLSVICIFSGLYSLGGIFFSPGTPLIFSLGLFLSSGLMVLKILKSLTTPDSNSL
jgi:SSS family solute:Na+ symporter